MEKGKILGIISLPDHTFKAIGGTGAKTFILYFVKGDYSKENYKIFFGKIEKVGYTSKSLPDDNDLPSMSIAFKKFLKGDELEESDNYNVVTKETVKNNSKLLFPDFYISKEYLKYVDNIRKHQHTSLADMGEIKGGPFGSSIQAKTDYVKTGIKLIQAQNVRENSYAEKGKFGGQNVDQIYITEEKHNELKGNSVSKNDVLITTTGSIGRSCVWELDEPSTLSSSVSKVTLNKEWLPEFVALMINHPMIRTQMNIYANSKTSQPSIRLTELKRILFPVYTLEQQKKIMQDIASFNNKKEQVLQKLDKVQKETTKYISEIFSLYL